MGDHTAGRKIVERAIFLWLSNPDMSALMVLDKAVEGNENTDAEFESTDPHNISRVHPIYDDERYLPSPFAEILRRAFAPDLDPREMIFAAYSSSETGVAESRIQAALDVWEKRVINPFSMRYGLF